MLRYKLGASCSFSIHQYFHSKKVFSQATRPNSCDGHQQINRYVSAYARHTYKYNRIAIDLRDYGYAYTTWSRNHREILNAYLICNLYLGIYSSRASSSTQNYSARFRSLDFLP